MKKRKKRLLSAILAFCMLPMFSFASAAAQSSGEELSISAHVDGMDIGAVEVDGKNYLFLPASADLDELSLRFEANDVVTLTGEKGSASAAGPVALTKIAGKDNASRYVLTAETKTGSKFRFYIMQGASMPTLYLHSDNAEKGRDWVDSSKSNEATGRMELIRADGSSIYDGSLTQIKVRGNSTFAHYPKKSYQIKLESKSDLLGTGEKGKTWVLLANYGDATMMHDKLFKDFTAGLGMDYVASCDWVNLYYDGEYRGVYLLSEKNSVGGTGVDITDMEDAYDATTQGYGDGAATGVATNRYGQKYQYTKNLVEPEDLTGGYLIERNHNYLDEVNGFYTKQGTAFNLKSPEWAGKEAVKYISEYYQAFESAVFATDAKGNYTGYNAETGKHYYEYVDLTSLVQIFLLQELGLNPDGFYSSLYFYKDAGEIMYAGPIWDQDMTLGTGWTKYISPQVMDYHYLAEALIQIPGFEAAVIDYFTNTFAPEVAALLEKDGQIAEYTDTLSANAAMNYILWPYVRIGDPSHEGHLWAEGTGYGVVTNDLQNWLTARLEILKKTFAIEAVDTQTTVNERGETVIVETRSDGSIATTVEAADGSTTITISKITAETFDVGNVNTTHYTITKRDPNGSTDCTTKVEAEITLTQSAVNQGAAIRLPLNTLANTRDENLAPLITIHTGSKSAVAVEIPVTEVSPGTVAVLVKEDGSQTILENTTPTAEGIRFEVSDGATVRILDKAKAFKDMDTTNWAWNAVSFTSSRGIFSGVSADRFDPNGTATRGMLFTVLARVAGQDTTAAEGEHWQQPGLTWATTNKISDGTNPDSPITREQLATMLYHYMGDPVSEGSLAGFTDGSKVSVWAVDAMEWAVDAGLYRGYGSGILNPNGTATRSEIAQVIMSFMTKVQNGT